jgi:hypothetical protein
MRNKRTRNGRVTVVEVIDSVGTMSEVGKGFPSVVLTKGISPMNEIKGLTTNKLEINDRIHNIFNMAINDNFRRRGKRLFLGRKERGVVGSEEGFVKDRMKSRPRGREIQFKHGRTNTFNDTEGAITSSFQLFRGMVRSDISAFEPNQIIFFEGP